MTHRNARALNQLVRELRAQSPQTTVGTYRAGTGSDSDHKPWLRDSSGIGVVRAADIMTRTGDTLARNLAAKLNQHPAMGAGAYVIWKQRIISADRLGEGWRSMEDRGDPTANHEDHVHVSLTKNQAGYDATNTWGALFTGRGTGAGPLPIGLGNNPTVGMGPVAVDLQGNPVGLGIPGLEVDDLAEGITKLVITGAALALGAVLVVLGAARATKPARAAVTDAGADAAQVASLAVPQLRAATAATTATKGAP